MDASQNRASREADAPISERTLARIQRFCLMHDVFMRVCLDGDIAAVQQILRVALKKPDLVVLSVRTQYELQSLHGTRSLRLDVLARDSANRLYNLEIQRRDVDPERGRAHSAVLDSSSLEAGEDFSCLPETWVIFIMERDPFKRGLPVYHFVRYMPEIGPGPERRFAHRVPERRDTGRPDGRGQVDARFFLHRPGQDVL